MRAPLILLVLLLACSDDTQPLADASSADAPAVDAAIDAAGADAPTGSRVLSSTGLYSDIRNKTVAADLIEFAPSYTLWADGAAKRRWIRLPPGTQIDTSTMDHWVFPVGTQFFKEFSLDGKRLETRLIERTGTGSFDYFMGAFVWLDDESDAVFVPDGVPLARGTDHEVPNTADCFKCHQGEAGRVLGFSAVQLSRSTPLPSVASLAQQNLLSAAPPNGADYAPPGDATAQVALGYLHANCGHCHNPNGFGGFFSMTLRLDGGDRTVSATTTYRSTVNVMLGGFSYPGYTYRVVPGHPEQSAILLRMSHRGDDVAMPPIFTKHVDDGAVQAVTTWIMQVQ